MLNLSIVLITGKWNEILIRLKITAGGVEQYLFMSLHTGRVGWRHFSTSAVVLEQVDPIGAPRISHSLKIVLSFANRSILHPFSFLIISVIIIGTDNQSSFLLINFTKRLQLLNVSRWRRRSGKFESEIIFQIFNVVLLYIWTWTRVIDSCFILFHVVVVS